MIYWDLYGFYIDIGNYRYRYLVGGDRNMTFTGIYSGSMVINSDVGGDWNMNEFPFSWEYFIILIDLYMFGVETTNQTRI